MYTIVGKKLVQSEYAGHAYTHCVLYCTVPDEKVSGLATEVIKIKRDALDAFGKIQVGEVYRFYYDKYKNVCEYIRDESAKK